ncbi:MAG: hypothetical protein HZB43_12650 [candidate division Zixibacteria bacterium]|nr:hypothetical protein [candidate division Zixibacteria bacterium]
MKYVEELFDVPDPQDRRSNPKWFYDMAAVQELRKMVSNDSVQLWFTGIAVNMCSLRPEILLLLHVKDASWLARHETGEAGAQAFRFSKEIAISGEAVGKLVLRPALHGTAGDMFQELQFFPDNTVPVGAAGIHLGIEALNSILLPPQAPQP